MTSALSLSRPHRLMRGAAVAALLLSSAGRGAEDAAAAPQLQSRLLNVIDTPTYAGTWNVEHCRAELAADLPPKAGAAAVRISGTAVHAGGKVDIPLFDGELPGCRALAVWVYATPESNVADVGFQVKDAKGEALLVRIPVDWTGWKQVEVDPTVAAFTPAYAQKEQDGQVDQPLQAVHVIWFAAAPGPTSLIIDGLTARTERRAGEVGLRLRCIGADVAEPGKTLDQRLLVENFADTACTAEISYALQVNPALDDSVPPDPNLGFDHALGCKNTFTVDGKDMGEAKLCDGDENSAAEAPWGGAYEEAVATVDLGELRQVIAVQWRSGDANWLWKVDVAASADGTTFTPVDGVQDIDMHAKWGRQKLPWPTAPVPARLLRFRFHDNGKENKCIRLPASLMIFDGAANDRVAVPATGEKVAAGKVSVTVPAQAYSEVTVAGTDPLGTGAYLLGLEADLAGRKEVRWSPLFVRPADTVDSERTRRFGINASDLAVAEEMRRCGFGWVRFENAKWQMFCTAPDAYAFDGTVMPWRVNHDAFFADYQKRGMKVLPYVFQPPEWATSAPKDVKRNRDGYPPEKPADYGEAIFQMVARYGNATVDPAKLLTKDKKSGLQWIGAVELWNEPNLNDPGWGPFVGPISRYFEVMRAGAEGARRADPSLPVSSCGWAGIGLEVIGQMSQFKYPDGKTPLELVDIVNVHFYSGREEPETCGWDPNVDRGSPATSGTTYPEQLADLVAWRDQLKPKAEIWLTETGNDVGGPIGRTERHQAGKVPRAVMIALAQGIDKVFIYRETGSDQKMHAGAGLLRNDLSVRPVWFTVATMLRQLQGFTGRARRLPVADPRVWMFLWQDGARQLISAWTYDGKAKLGVDLGKASVCDAFGRVTAVEHTADVELSEMPTYLTLTAAGPGFEKLLADAAVAATRRAAERAALANRPALLFDFGPTDQQLGVLKGYGLPRVYTAVDKDTVWNEERGYGFSEPAMSDECRTWKPDRLERDGCKFGPGNAFKFRLPAGRFRVRLSAEPVKAKSITLEFRTAAGTEQKTVTDSGEHVFEFSVAGGGPPVEVSVLGFGNGLLNWISAIGEAEAAAKLP